MADRKIAAMHKVFGKASGHICADCPALICKQGHGRRYYKCYCYGDSASTATDWAKSWIACGLWGQPIHKGHVALIHRLKHDKKANNQPIDGQISMFGGAEDDNP